MIRRAIKTFFKSEISIGILLIIATIFALSIANSHHYEAYHNFFDIEAPLTLPFIDFHIDFTIHKWINDGMMAVFFLLVGLELKREILIGELSSKKKIILPTFAALGGIIVPALTFIAFNIGHDEMLRGFAIPTATDIAFAYGMISLFGKKISNSLKVFLVALAVLDDLIAILIITFFYSHDLNPDYLILSLIPIVGMLILNLKNSGKISLYMILGSILWMMIYKSGIHATLAGVLTALFLPLQVKNSSPLSKLAHKIAPVVNFLILPLFAFANAGVRVENISLAVFYEPLVLGIILGLFLGKQIGVLLFSFVAVKLKIAHLPRGANWFEFYGAAIFTGIGFTMSLFIGSLAFANNSLLFDESKIGILTGSFLSMIFGILVTYIATARSKKTTLKNIIK